MAPAQLRRNESSTRRSAGSGRTTAGTIEGFIAAKKMIAANPPGERCKYHPACRKSYVSRKAYQTHLAKSHKAEEENERQRKKVEEMERERVEAINKRQGLHAGLHAQSRGIAEMIDQSVDMDDIIQDLEMNWDAPWNRPTISSRQQTPERWETSREVDNEDAPDLDEESHTDPSRPDHKQTEQPFYKVVEYKENLDAGDDTSYGTVPAEKLLFDVTGMDPKRGPWFPFRDAFSFNMARWLSKYRASSAMIREGYNCGLLAQPDSTEKGQFHSTYSLRRVIDMMEPQFAGDKWEARYARFYADEKNEFQRFYFRRLPPVIRHFFRQPAFRDYFVYRSQEHYNDRNQRVYSDMYTGKWWRRMEDSLPKGSTLVPLLFASDGTQLSTHAGDHDFWPIYMSVGNLPASLRSRPSTNSWILIGLFPFPPKKDDYLGTDNGEPCKATGRDREEYQKYKADVFHQVLHALLDFDLRSMFEEGLQLDCADGKVRCGRPVIGAWIADYLEYNKLYQIKKDGCCVCEISKSQLGDNIPGTPRSPILDMQQFIKLRGFDQEIAMLQREVAELEKDPKNMQLSKAALGRIIAPKTKALKAKIAEKKKLELYFSDRQLHTHYNTFWNTPLYTGRNVWKPDILHTLYQGMIRHSLTWIKLFLQHHGRYAQWEAAWVRIPAFHGLPTPKRAIGQNKQFTGKLLRNAVKYLIPTLVIALKDPSKEQAFVFDRALKCIRYLVDFTLVCQYKYHTEDTISSLQHYLERFHQHKDVFKDFRTTAEARKAAKEKANEKKNALMAELSTKVVGSAPILPPELTDKDESGAPTSLKKTKTTSKKKKELQQRIASLDDDSPLREWVLDGLRNANFIGDQMKERVTTVEEFIEAIALDQELEILSDKAHFDFIKIHLLTHFAETIEEFGALEQYSTEIGETLHKGVKEAYRSSNKHNHLDQILRFCTRVYAIRMRELNLIQLAKDGYWREEIQGVLQLYASRRDRRLAAKLNREGRSKDVVMHLKRDEQQGVEDDSGYEGETDYEEEERKIRKTMAAKEKMALQAAMHQAGLPADEPSLESPSSMISRSETQDDEEEDTDVEEGISHLTVQEQKISMPPPVPLFSEEELRASNRDSHPLFAKYRGEAATTRWLGGKVKHKKLDLDSVSKLYSLPNLVPAVKSYLHKIDPEYLKLKIENAEVGSLLVQLHTSIHVRTEAIQAADRFETLKAVCSGPKRVGNNRMARNDSVIFLDCNTTESPPRNQSQTSAMDIDIESGSRGSAPIEEDSEDEVTHTEHPNQSAFGPFRCGNLACLFSLKVPLPAEWGSYRLTRSSGIPLPDDYFTIKKLAYMQPLKVEMQSDGSDMIDGAEVAILNNGPASMRGLVVMDISKVCRPAHLILVRRPPDDKSRKFVEKFTEKRQWIMNNRIDMGTWYAIYGAD